MDNLRINVIIPCFNESKFLPATLTALLDLSKKYACKLDIILMDNGSTDQSVQIAENIGVRAFIEPDATIGRLRNLGAKKVVKGELFVFIDADIVVTDIWMKSVCDLARQSNLNHLFITGYPYLPPSQASWLERHWFQDEKKNLSYINSGNLITTKYLFEILDGFDEVLKTGEDWDFCFRAKKKGAQVVPNKDFKVHHNGYPKTLSAFFKREMWHGVGDCQSISRFLKSRPAVFSLLWALGSTLAIGLLLLSRVKMLGLLLLLFSSAPAFWLARQRSQNLRLFPGNLVIALTYLGGRFGSVALLLWQNINIRYKKSPYRWR